jgi:hypothetical protein
LEHALHNGNCTDVLVPLAEGDVGGDVSHAQSKRAMIQCIVVLEFFLLLEASAQQNGGELPEGGVYETAAQAGKCALFWPSPRPLPPGLGLSLGLVSL